MMKHIPNEVSNCEEYEQEYQCEDEAVEKYQHGEEAEEQYEDEGEEEREENGQYEDERDHLGQEETYSRIEETMVNVGDGLLESITVVESDEPVEREGDATVNQPLEEQKSTLIPRQNVAGAALVEDVMNLTRQNPVASTPSAVEPALPAPAPLIKINIDPPSLPTFSQLGCDHSWSSHDSGRTLGLLLARFVGFACCITTTVASNAECSHAHGATLLVGPISWAEVGVAPSRADRSAPGLLYRDDVGTLGLDILIEEHKKEHQNLRPFCYADFGTALLFGVEEALFDLAHPYIVETNVGFPGLVPDSEATMGQGLAADSI
ncbi:hypothetical protein BCR34DRAFT_594727 [Clohesyomyces aquaticus]|uniref:Uncharacterized protein n=1 Tax=Clohesyomyces aquaticus TaxID=1231657 RepID=A0A1Y1Y5H8_9PLEO|nr:hypothetical protein BCR34DRAFT_594727 [Clohesyomyces aquaticus]